MFNVGYQAFRAKAWTWAHKARDVGMQEEWGEGGG